MSVSSPLIVSERRAATANLALEANDVSKTFVSRTGLWSTPRYTHALMNVSFELQKGEILAVVGESGSGKSTLGRMLVGLERADTGWIRTGQEVLLDTSRRIFLPPARRGIGMIFQDPSSSLNGRMRVETIVGEGLLIAGQPASVVRERVGTALELVGLRASDMHRYPHEFSGGQRQRIGIARAIALEPGILIADEATSSLDVSVQMQILNLLLDIRERLNLSIIFITHNIAVVEYLCDFVLVMSRGEVVERGRAGRVIASPEHPYTKRLLAAVPRL